MNNNDEIKQLIAERLTLARKNAGLSQGQAAKMMQMHRPTISEIEAGRRKVSADELISFSEIYKVSMNWLTGTQEDENKLKSEIEIAARQLENIKKEDMDKVINFLKTLNTKE